MKLTRTVTNGLGRLLGCWHLHLSRPITFQGETYRICSACGVRRRFDLERWETVGPFYPPAHSGGSLVWPESETRSPEAVRTESLVRGGLYPLADLGS